MPAPFEKLEGTIKSAAGVVALIPGIAIFTRAITLPPQLHVLLGGLSLAFGVAVVMTIFLYRRRLSRVRADRIGLAVIALALVGVIAGIGLYGFAETHIIRVGETTLVAPLQPTGNLEGYLRTFRGDYAEMLANPFIGSVAQDDMRKQSGSAVWILSIGLMVVQTLLLTAIVLGAWKVAESRRSTD